MAVQSVSRAMGILDLFSPDRPLLGVTEIAEGMGLGKTTVHALIKTLVSGGFLQQDLATSKYCLGLKLLELGHITSGNLEINQKAVYLVQRLAMESRHICRVGLWSQNSIVVVLEAQPGTTGSFPYQFGPRVPAYCTSLGKAVLAHLRPVDLEAYLDETRLTRRTPQTITDPEALRADLTEAARRGYSISDREVVHTQSGLGAPVFGRQGKVLGAISISGSPDNIVGGRTAQLGSSLVDAANSVSRQMGYHPERHTINF